MYKLIIFLLFISTLLYAPVVDARNGWQGCCSWHGGIAGYCRNGRMVCNDGTLSTSCYCDDLENYNVPVSPNYSMPYGYQNRSFSRGNWSTSPLPTTSQGNIVMTTSYGIGELDTAALALDLSPKKTITSSPWYISAGGTKYYISTTVYIPFNYYSDKKQLKLYYSIDGSEFIELKVIGSTKLIGCILIDFHVNDYRKFCDGLRRGNLIRFRLENNGWCTTLAYSLIGFSYVYGNSISYLEKLNS